MAASAPGKRRSNLPKSWDDMQPEALAPAAAPSAAEAAPVHDSSTPATVPGTPADTTASPPPTVGNSQLKRQPNAKKKRATRVSFWREHKNLVLTAAVLICPSLAMLVLVMMARWMHPFEGDYYEGRTLSQWVSLLGDDDPILRSKAFDTLVRLGNEATPQLSRALLDVNVQRRRDAAMAFQKIRPTNKHATEALAGALSDRDVWVRWRSAQALRSIGPHARDAVTPLAQALSDDDPRVRCAAAQALGRIGKDAVIAHSALVSAMQDERDYVRKAASAAMDSIMAEVGE